MKHTLPPLPYALDALEPHMSKETLEFHHGKHHQAYVTQLNELIQGSQFENASLEEIVRHSSGALFNNAGQAWNHGFFWQCLSPKGGGKPEGDVGRIITSSYGSFSGFRDHFSSVAEGQFGSGWAWLVRTEKSTLEVISTANADTPIRSGATVLLTCDVWEHAYYLDHRNSRADYLKAFWNLVNWDFVARNWAGAGTVSTVLHET
ncbi:MAG TPA: superoxide dismutase [Burkholderiales bacterium]|nr:superoxide dismutase [Burkholderiales bacterium]